MPEGNVNAEIANHLREHGEHDEPAADQPSKRRIETIEILEAILLAIVAIVTALSGYQAARWDGESAREYATSSRLRTESTETHLSANEMLLYNAGNLTAWLQAYDGGDQSSAEPPRAPLHARVQVAFDAWVAIDGMNDPSAPPGPRYMPEYEDPLAEEATELGKEASHAFDLGVEYRENRRALRAHHRPPRRGAVPDRHRAALQGPWRALLGQHRRRDLPRLLPLPVRDLPAPLRRRGSGGAAAEARSARPAVRPRI